MSYVYYNPNPLKLSVGDCTIRAISCALNISWKRTYLSLALQGFIMYDMPSANRVWGQFLKSKGFKKYQLPDTCPDCYTIRDFCYDLLIRTNDVDHVEDELTDIFAVDTDKQSYVFSKYEITDCFLTDDGLVRVICVK